MNDDPLEQKTGENDQIIHLRTLASGSSGNATFLRFGDTRILVDVGISYRMIKKNLGDMNEPIDRLSAVLITHEHSDHIKGAARLQKRHPELPVYTTFGTAEACRKAGKWSPTNETIEAQRSFQVDAVDVLPFRTSHDASESVGFRFNIPGFSLGYATDLGKSTREVVDALDGCHALVVEANYEEQMLRWGPYPAFLKKRIAGHGGHLSNSQARQLLDKVSGPQLETVVLCHLSEKNNAPNKAVAAAAEGVGRRQVRIIAADRKSPGPILGFRTRTANASPRQGQLPLV